MKIPTIQQFNTWSEKDRAWYVDYETDGSYKDLLRSGGYFPMIIYERENVAIVYQVNDKGQITEARAMTVQEAFDRLAQFDKAAKAVLSFN